MEENKIKKIYEILDSIMITEENADLIEEIRNDLMNKNYILALKKMEKLNEQSREEKKKNKEKAEKEKKQKEEKKLNSIFPKELQDEKLEHDYIALLLRDPRYIVKYYFIYDECFFENPEYLNIYKSVLFTEGGAYSSETAKANFNFAKDNEESFKLKAKLKEEIEDKSLDMQEIYLELKKLFILRKSYLEVPIKEIQDRIVEIKDYLLYSEMSEEEVKNAIIQVNDTGKFKRSILNRNLTSFLELGDNNLRNGLVLPFPILSSVFKGIRKGETMAFAMPSNSGKSRFTIDLAAYTALVHKKKVLIISNEMSEEKMKLCLITTIINNEEIQKLHGQKLSKTEGELLEFKFRPDNKKDAKLEKLIIQFTL